VLDQRGRLLMAALGFATLPMPSYDRALHATLLARRLARHWRRQRRGVPAVDAWAGVDIGREGDVVVRPFNLSRWFTFGGVAANLVVR
jgi:hypothetical protein